MKIKTDFFGFFTKSNGKWSKMPYKGELVTKQDIIDSGILDDESAPYKEQRKAYLKGFKKQTKKKVKMLRQVWEE